MTRTRQRHCEVIDGALVHFEGEPTAADREAVRELLEAVRKQYGPDREPCRGCGRSYRRCFAIRATKTRKCCDHCLHPVVRK